MSDSACALRIKFGVDRCVPACEGPEPVFGYLVGGSVMMRLGLGASAILTGADIARGAVLESGRPRSIRGLVMGAGQTLPGKKLPRKDLLSSIGQPDHPDRQQHRRALRERVATCNQPGGILAARLGV